MGGLAVLSKLTAAMPHERFVYLADSACMPYGGKPDVEIKRAALRCADALFSMNCKAVVVACNTATAVAIDDIRRLYGGRIVVGLEPAVKPCVKELGRNGYAVALVTPATCASRRFAALAALADGRIKVAPQPALARIIEDNFGSPSLYGYVREILQPYRDAESVILGCSHYSCIAKHVAAFYEGKVKIYDGADGVAARLLYRLALGKLSAPMTERGSLRFYDTYNI